MGPLTTIVTPVTPALRSIARVAVWSVQSSVDGWSKCSYSNLAGILSFVSVIAIVKHASPVQV